MTAKTGRNDPCKCGSGKKYKVCCGKKSLFIFEHKAFKDDKTMEAVDLDEAKAAFEAWFNGEQQAGRMAAEQSFFEGTVYLDGSRVQWHFDHPALPKLKTCEAATQVEAWELFDKWWKDEVAAARLSGNFADGRIYRATDMPKNAPRAFCPHPPKHRDSKGSLLCAEHAGTAEGILIDVGLTDANNAAGFRCARGARLA